MRGTDRHLQDILHKVVLSHDMSLTDWLVDIVICAGAFGFGLLQLTLSANVLIPDDFIRRLLGVNLVAPSYIAVTATFFTCVPVVLRRVAPWVAFVLSMGFWIGFELSYDLSSLSLAGPLISLFTLTYICSKWQSLCACAIALCVIFVAVSSSFSSTMTKLLALQNCALTIAVSFAGYALHTRQEYLEEANERASKEESLRESETLRAQEAERTREAEARRRVEEERFRIGRELHDITAHSLTAISIQSEAALRLLESNPEAAREPMETVRAISRESLDEIRSMIGALRTGEDLEGRQPMEPTRGMDDMAYLSKYLEDAGIGCSLELESAVGDMPAYIGVALYGIAREAVTNVVKHADAQHAWIRISYDSQGKTFRMVVEDDGIGFPLEGGKGAGHGMDGMRERTEVLSGTFSAGKSEYGGAKVEVALPVVEGGE